MSVWAKRAVVAFVATACVVAAGSAVYDGMRAYRALVPGDQQISESASTQVEGLPEAPVEAQLSEAPEAPEAADPSPQTPPSAAASDARQCPLQVAGGTERAWRSNAAGCSWSYVTGAGMTEVAARALDDLARDGWALVEAGYLGLDDRSWGCVARDAQGSGVLMLYGVPARLPDGSQGSSVTVVELLAAA